MTAVKEADLDIVVLGPAGSERLERFQGFVQERGYSVRRLPAARLLLDPGRARTGVVLFADGEPEVAATVDAVREQLRYLSVPLVTVTSNGSTEHCNQLQRAGADHVCGPDTSDALILEEIETRCAVQAIPPEVREQFVEPFIEAVCVAMREWAGTEAFVRAVYRKTRHTIFGDIAVRLGLTSSAAGALVLSFPTRLAALLARRILAGVTEEPARDIIQDCLGEIANVTAGQAKALLAGTPYWFTFATPTVVSGAGQEIATGPGSNYLVVVFRSDQGDFALQLCLTQ